MDQEKITVTLPDGGRHDYERGITPRQIAEDLSHGLARKAIAAVVDGEKVDLSRPIISNAQVQILVRGDEAALEIFRHSSAHLLAAAVKDIFPEVKFGIGPPIEDGFFYDFDVAKPFTPADLEKIEVRMKELAAEKIPYEREEIPKSEALTAFGDMGQDLKVELIDEKGDDIVSCYRLGSFYDFCEGPHVPDSGVIKAIKVLGSSAAYWKGDESNRPMQRIYATTFYDRKILTEHLRNLEEARKRDHRKLGKELGLFLIASEAPGQVFWLPKGQRIVNLLTDYMRDKLERYNYLEIRTPLVMDEQLWQRSGHLDHYADNMFVIESEEVRYRMKPMNCPGAAIVYQSSLRSYRELPLRFSEFGHCHRYERSGVLSGLTRVRAFVQDDAHIYATLEQVCEEVVDLIALTGEVYSDFGFKDIRVELSTRPNSSLGTDEQWEEAEGALTHALEKTNSRYKTNVGDGAFYGPKIDFHAKDAIGRSHQLATIQVDFSQAERFDLYYAAEDGSRKRPVTIHRAILGSIERFIAVLIEHTGGAFPIWLAPVQAVVLPISERHHQYAKTVHERIRADGFRCVLDVRNEKVGYKIREAQLQKIPFMLVVGDREMETHTVAVRSREQGDLGQKLLQEFMEELRQLQDDKVLSG